MEQNEREWRRKEAAVAAARVAAEAELLESREQQRRHKQHSLAVQAHREKINYERIIKFVGGGGGVGRGRGGGRVGGRVEGERVGGGKVE